MRKWVTFHLSHSAGNSRPTEKTIGEEPAATVLKTCQFPFISLLKLSLRPGLSGPAPKSLFSHSKESPLSDRREIR